MVWVPHISLRSIIIEHRVPPYSREHYYFIISLAITVRGENRSTQLAIRISWLILYNVYTAAQRTSIQTRDGRRRGGIAIATRIRYMYTYNKFGIRRYRTSRDGQSTQVDRTGAGGRVSRGISEFLWDNGYAPPRATGAWESRRARRGASPASRVSRRRVYFIPSASRLPAAARDREWRDH